MQKPYRVYVLKSSRGGRPITNPELAGILKAIERELKRMHHNMGRGRLIVEVKSEKEAIH